MKKFDELGLSGDVLKSITDLGYETPTEIQEKSIPILLEKEQDFIGLAQTGTGKTAAFGLPLIEYIDSSKKETQALIIAPTRELGQQIAAEIQKFLKYSDKIESQVVYGGASISDQIRLAKRKTPHIIIGTPGRLCDLLRRKAIKLDGLRFFVLDEADEMLNMGFKEEIDAIFEFIAQKVNTWLFSATMPKEIRSIVKNYMDPDYQEVSIKSENKVNTNIEHQYVIIRVAEKLEVLKRFLDFSKMRAIIFCRTRIDTQNVADELGKDGYRVEPLHGDLSQQKRNSVLNSFRAGNLEIVVATDVAARGIDVDDLTHVVHYRLPDSMETYTHRSGRTARAGKKGISLSFVTKGEVRRINELSKRLKIKFEKALIPTLESIHEQRLVNWANSIVESPVAKVDESLMGKINLQLLELEKEELVAKLISLELTKMSSSDSRNDLNVAGRDDDRDDRGARKGFVSMVVNMGRMDEMSVPDFLEMIDSVSGIAGRNIGDIGIRSKHTTFQVKEEQVDQIMQGFEGMEYNGRPIKVHKDEQSGGGSRNGRSGDRNRNRSGGSRSGGGYKKRSEGGFKGRSNNSNSRRRKF